MPRGHIKREVDLQIISDWIGEKERVLDLGCGRGLFLEHLKASKSVYGIGVDNDPHKIKDAIARGINVYQGDIEAALSIYKPGFFDCVILSRTLHELHRPHEVISKALELGRKLAVGFVNYGYWENRLSIATSGARPTNDVYPDSWSNSRPANPVSINEFEHYCHSQRYTIIEKAYLDGSWRKPITLAPNLFAGYAIYAITDREDT